MLSHRLFGFRNVRHHRKTQAGGTPVGPLGIHAKSINNPRELRTDRPLSWQTATAVANRGHYRVMKEARITRALDLSV